MTVVVVSMLIVTLIAGAVVAYVAFPHRGEQMPVVPKLGEAMGKAVDAMPTLDETAEPVELVGRRR